MISRRAFFSFGLAEPDPAPPPSARLVLTQPDTRDWVHAARGRSEEKLATVQTFSCLNRGADFCATCVERCPTPGAIRVDGRRVVIDPVRCTGCGDCALACPAPGGAILLVPR